MTVLRETPHSAARERVDGTLEPGLSRPEAIWALIAPPILLVIRRCELGTKTDWTEILRLNWWFHVYQLGGQVQG